MRSGGRLAGTRLAGRSSLSASNAGEKENDVDVDAGDRGQRAADLAAAALKLIECVAARCGRAHAKMM